MSIKILINLKVFLTKMNEEIGLGSLSSALKHIHIKLNLNFLNKLLQNASKSNKPHKNRDFAKEIKCPINKTKKAAISVYSWMNGYKTVPFSRLIKIINLSSIYSWRDIEKNLISMKAGPNRGEIRPKFPIFINEKLGAIVGHILGDGSIDKRFHSIFFSNSNLHLLNEFRKNMISIFGIEPRIWIQKKKKSFEEKSKWIKRVNNLNKVPKKHNVGLFYPKICCDILYSICEKFAEGRKKKITKKIKTLNKNFKKGLLRAFFDDECSVDPKSYNIRFHQDDKQLLKDIKLLLKDFDINSNPTRSYMKKGKIRYYFNITGFKEYYILFKIIGCTMPKKRKGFRLLINKVKNSRGFKKKYALSTPINSDSWTMFSNKAT